MLGGEVKAGKGFLSDHGRWTIDAENGRRFIVRGLLNKHSAEDGFLQHLADKISAVVVCEAEVVRHVDAVLDRLAAAVTFDPQGKKSAFGRATG
jgi:hypothetical protein